MGTGVSRSWSLPARPGSATVPKQCWRSWRVVSASQRQLVDRGKRSAGCAEQGGVMESENKPQRLYEVERSARHAERPGFRINELQIGPTQKVPWHYHSTVQDTFFVLQGRIS